jgi:hypothetical protein
MAELVVPAVEVAPWLDDRRFAYSITYDEGLVEILGFAWRLHRDFGFPGHINAFPGRLGRLEGDASAGFLQSLWNLRKYAEAGQLRDLHAEGWSAGCQYGGGSGTVADTATLTAERQELSERLECDVTFLAFEAGPSWQANAEAAREAGYRWLMPVYDDLNPAGESGAVIRRSPLYHRGPAPNRLANDPYRLLARAADERGWQVDVVRLVDRYPADAARDCTPAELERRFRAVQEIGEGSVWLANPETVAAYRAGRAATRLEPAPAEQTGAAWIVRGTPSPVTLTFLVTLDPRWRSPRAGVDGTPVDLRPHPDGGRGCWMVNAQVQAGQRLRVAQEAA